MAAKTSFLWILKLDQALGIKSGDPNGGSGGDSVDSRSDFRNLGAILFW